MANAQRSTTRKPRRRADLALPSSVAAHLPHAVRMVTLRDSLVSSSARELPIRKRPDLTRSSSTTWARSTGSSRTRSGCTTSASRRKNTRSCRCSTAQTSLDEIKERFEDEFPPQKITLEELQQFLGMLHRSGLVIADVPGQGEQLRKRRDERKRKELLGARQQHPVHPLQGHRPRAAAELALSQGRAGSSRPAVRRAALLLALSAADAGGRAVRRLPLASCPTFHQFFSVDNCALAGRRRWA